ncbi:MAG TPA: tetratricopeptide repeat protein [Planctomycetes bacterium]|nr:tetratricopeptide repeat protein [Planctomycetota bacterium]
MTAPTPETKASEEQKRPRFRTVLIVVLTIATAGAAAWMLNRSAGRLSLVEQPEVDLASSSRAVVQTIQQAQTRVDSSPDDAIAWGELGMVLFAHQFEAEARACFEQAERLDPQEFRWPYLHGVCAAATDRTAAADLFQRAVTLKPEEGIAHNRLGEVLLDLARYEETAFHLEAAQRLLPRDVRPLLALARLEHLRGRSQAALTWAEQAVRAAPQERAVYELLAIIHATGSEQVAARRALEIAQTLPDRPLRWRDALAAEVLELRRDTGWRLLQAESLLSQRRSKEAIDLLRSALREDDRDPRIYCALARGLLVENQVAAAAETLERARRRHPDSAEVRFQRGVVHFVADEFRQAEQHFRRATELKPDYALAHYNRGLVLDRLGEKDAGLNAFETAVRYRPQYAAAHFHAGRILLEQGRKKQAIVHLQAVIRFAPADREARRLLEQVGPTPN